MRIHTFKASFLRLAFLQRCMAAPESDAMYFCLIFLVSGS